MGSGKFMPSKRNPFKLNPLQMRTLTLLQGLAVMPGMAVKSPDGEITITRFPASHGDHLHFAGATVAKKDATGLYNEAVWHALARKGLARADWPQSITLTIAGQTFNTGLAGEIFHPTVPPSA